MEAYFDNSATTRCFEEVKDIVVKTIAPSQTPLRQVAIFLHNADFPHLRVTKPPPNSPAERCCFALVVGCVRGNG